MKYSPEQYKVMPEDSQSCFLKPPKRFQMHSCKHIQDVMIPQRSFVLALYGFVLIY